jgi:hypothetical protein
MAALVRGVGPPSAEGGRFAAEGGLRPRAAAAPRFTRAPATGRPSATQSPPRAERAHREAAPASSVRDISVTDERPDPELDDERRRYYRLTKPGRRALSAARAKKVYP